MTDKLNWTREDFKAYLMMHCANADYIETASEKELILSKIDSNTYKKIHKEFEGDNDYQRLQKIAKSAKFFGYNKSNANVLLDNMKKLFFHDLDMNILEENMFRGLKHILD